MSIHSFSKTNLKIRTRVELFNKGIRTMGTISTSSYHGHCNIWIDTLSRTECSAGQRWTTQLHYVYIYGNTTKKTYCYVQSYYKSPLLQYPCESKFNYSINVLKLPFYSNSHKSNRKMQFVVWTSARGQRTNPIKGHHIHPHKLEHQLTL